MSTEESTLGSVWPLPFARSYTTLARQSSYPGWRADLLAEQMRSRSKIFLVAKEERPVRGARRLIEETLTKWGLAALVADASVCVSELVTNVQEHAMHPLTGDGEHRVTEVGLELFAPTEVFLSVADDDPAMPCLAEPDDWSESGRGLRTVAGLCDGWWPCRRSVGGKVVYLRFDLSRYGGCERWGGVG